MLNTSRSAASRSISRQTSARRASSSSSPAVTPMNHVKNALSPSPKPCHTETTWESYGFGIKECGWGAWYLVP
ncbi:hypothetical protein ACA910_016456 [Epithemia clementina (nom. ined.)]